MKNLGTILSILLLLGFSSWVQAQGGSALESQAAQLQEQGPALQALMQRSHEAQADPAFTAEILRGAKSLEDQGLPAEPYLLKANEGLAKKVAPRRMMPALEQTVSRTRSAGTLVDEALARGATATPASRRQAILKIQSALMSGRSQGDLQKAFQSGLGKEKNPNLFDLSEEAAGIKRVPKVKTPKAPDLPGLEYPSGSEKPGKKSNVQEKSKGKSKPAYQKQEKSKGGPSKGSHGNSKGNSSGKGRRK